ncbi:flavodoxin [Paraburkholderia sp. UYCP14C]|uniref:flavodoxin family protein n=1 Tax=Paraburkholderia sp. UYCP14C TaxID=2511130 RepID=UPI001021713D|nr:flavodoxin [Paraburkholderia sp. UYCP14C]RZF25658.1 flavodoxin [Paraburkholderia sp. UYCP14C]
MTPNKILVVFYSRSGTTRKVASVLARMLGADVEEIVDRGARGGPFGYVRSLVEAMHARPSQIAPPKHDASDYDLVVIGSPVWSGTVSSPVRAYLYANFERLNRVAFFCCFARRGGESALKEMNALCGAAPLAECCVTAREARHGDASRVLSDFVERIERKLAEIQQLGANQRELT